MWMSERLTGLMNDNHNNNNNNGVNVRASHAKGGGAYWQRCYHQEKKR